VFENSKVVVGMLHVPALPGSPRCTLTLKAVREFVLADAAALIDGGVDGLMIENFGDVPFFPVRVPAHTIAFLTVLAAEVRARYSIPLGINVLRNDGLAAMAVAAAVEASYIRVNVYTGARLADQGILEGEAHEITRLRRVLGAEAQIWADVAVKHSASIGSRLLTDEVEDTIGRGLADALIVSGAGTGKETPMDAIRAAKGAAKTARVLVGSGAEAGSVERLLEVADGVIVGSALKHDGSVSQPVDAGRVRAFMAAARRSR
jgi:membrane complex biogenesis BtpA family protein